MEQDVLTKLSEQEEKINQIYISVEKTRKYFKWTLIITLALTLLPLIGIVYELPTLMSVYSPAAIQGI